MTTESVKIDKLTEVARTVQEALDRRTFWLAMGVIIPLMVGAVLLWHINDSANAAQKHARSGEIQAQRAFIQSLENARTLIVGQIAFAQTRDCPVQYLRSLTIASRRGEDITAVNPPCEPIDLTALQEQLIVREDAIKGEQENLKRLEKSE